MAFDFPNGAVNNQLYTADSGVVYRFDGDTWVVDGTKEKLDSVNEFTASYYTDSASFDSKLDNLISATSSYLTSETDSQTLSIDGDQLSISNGNTVTIPIGSQLPSGVISGSSQLTSSFDTRYALSGSFVSSSNVSSIQTITSASYAAITPVSGTLYIIIG